MSEKPEDQHDSVVLHLCAECTQDLRRYNLPTADDEVAAIIPGDGSEIRSDHRDIVLRLKGGGLQRISYLHPAYASLHYVLLFPHGEDGWHTGIPAQPGAPVACNFVNNSSALPMRPVCIIPMFF